MKKNNIKITFGMIVLNGEPFIKFNLRSLYTFAHEVIIVEGASPDASAIATPDGHSNDGTLDTIREFIRDEDPENKIMLITAEDEGYPNGFWPGEKDEQSRVYAKYATGNYLWQVDSDEFYRADEIERLMEYLDEHPEVTAVSFPMITFWGDPYTWVDSWYLHRGANQYHRLFKWGSGYTYSTHRPPTVLDDQGRNTRDIHWLNRKQLLTLGVYLYHYSLLFPRQVYEKCKYYEDSSIISRKGAVDWFNDNYIQLKNPYFLHNFHLLPGWINKWEGEVPKQILEMTNEIKRGNISEKIRENEDIAQLLSSKKYNLICTLLLYFDHPHRVYSYFIGLLKRIIRKLIRIGLLPKSIVI